MHAVEATHCTKLRTLTRLYTTCVICGPNRELAALVAIFLSAALQTELVLI